MPNADRTRTMQVVRTSSGGMGIMRIWIVIVGALAWGVAAPLWAQTPKEPAKAETAPPETGAYAGEMPDVTPTFSLSPDERKVWDPERVDDFSLIDQTGSTVTLADLKGRPWVANFIFTRCVYECPLMCRKIRDLIRELNKDPARPNSVRFVTITVDPHHDSLKLIQQFAGIYGADSKEWLFLTGDKEPIYQLIRHGFKVAAWEKFGSDRLPGMEFAHGMHLIHVDETGKILGRYESMNDQDLVTLQRVLQGKIETPKRHRPALLGTRLPGELVAVTPTEETDLGAPRVDPLAKLPAWARRLPRTNAALNALATMLLLTGFVAIKARNVSLHKRLMLFAFCVSIAFLGCYLTYHFALHQHTGEHGKKFLGTPAISKVYYTILITHVILATAVPVLASMTIWRGLKEQWESHRRWAKVTFPIWLYVSVTGVIIYWMLYHVST